MSNVTEIITKILAYMYDDIITYLAANHKDLNEFTETLMIFPLIRSNKFNSLRFL